MSKPERRIRHEQWLLELTGIPTAAGKESRVVRWVQAWVRQRQSLTLESDRAGNLLITRGDSGRERDQNRDRAAPLYITAHLDHPAFVVTELREPDQVELEFRGGVHDPYFDGAAIEIFDEHDRPHRATITHLDATAVPFKRVTARLSRGKHGVQVGDIGRWALRGRGATPTVHEGRLYAPACDDLAGVAAALSALDVLMSRQDTRHVGVLLTVAEEVGFVGTIAACLDKTLPPSARLICLENSRSFPDSPIGAGPIVRVGDRMSVFSPELTNRVGLLLLDHQKKNPGFTYQRKLMPGGTCEATAFASFGYESTCFCLPLGNYHNMRDIDAVQAGRRPARVGPEFIALDDYHGLVELVVLCAEQLDGNPSAMRDRMESLYRERSFVLG